MQYVRIPKDRIPVLIGDDGKIRKQIEAKTGAMLRIDSSEGTVTIDLSKAEDPMHKLKVRDVIKAIGRGFNPKKAMNIIDRDHNFELIDIKEYAGNNPKRIKQLKGRLIGKEGKTRRLVENLTDCRLSIYGHTVGMIGEVLNVSIAKTAIDMLLEGSKHAKVYQYLESKQRDLRYKDDNYFYDGEEI